MNSGDIERLTSEWNQHELDSLKVYIDARNSVKNEKFEELVKLDFSKAQKCKAYMEWEHINNRSKTPEFDEGKLSCLDMFDGDKLSQLKDIYSHIHRMDFMGQVDIAMWNFRNEVEKFAKRGQPTQLDVYSDHITDEEADEEAAPKKRLKLTN